MAVPLAAPSWPSWDGLWCDGLFPIGKFFELGANFDGFDAGAGSAGGVVNGGDWVVVVCRPAPEVGAALDEFGADFPIILFACCGHVA